MTLPGTQAMPPAKEYTKIPPKRRGVSLLACIIILVLVCGCLSMGIFSTDNTGPVSLTISGSTMVQPISEVLADAFTARHPEITVTVQGGDSAQGILDAGEGRVSLGSSTRMPDAGEIARYPALQVHRIGGSAVVVIVHRDVPIDSIQKDDLARLFDGTSQDIRQYPGLDDIRATVQRSDNAGTEEVFATWLFGSGVTDVDNARNASDRTVSGTVITLAAEGNQEVLDRVRNTPGSIGFVDFGFSQGDPEVKMMRIALPSGEVFPGAGKEFGPAIRDELALQNGMNDRYIEELTRPLLYLTNGPPNPWEEAFISFARSPDSAGYFREAGYTPNVVFSR